jgi:hypothetical protein
MLVAFTASCQAPSESSAGMNGAYSVAGVAQKGPFIRGTEVELRELDSDMVPTGRILSATIVDDAGSFNVRGTLTSPYVELSASGYYFDEVAGELTNAPLTLRGVADVREVLSMNLNVLTHLESSRVYELVDAGLTFVEAKRQARSEILVAFGVDENQVG